MTKAEYKLKCERLEARLAKLTAIGDRLSWAAWAANINKGDSHSLEVASGISREWDKAVWEA